MMAEPELGGLMSRGYILPLGRKKDGSMTWAVPGFAMDVFEAVTLPGDVYAGRQRLVTPDGQYDPQAIKRVTDLAGMVTLGSGAIPAEGNSLRMGVKTPGTRADLQDALRTMRLTRADPGDGPPISAALVSGARGGRKAKHYIEALAQHGVEISADDAARLRADNLAISDLRSQRARGLFGARDALDTPQAPADRLQMAKASAQRLSEKAAHDERLAAESKRLLGYADDGLWRKDFAERAVKAATLGMGKREAARANMEAVPRLLRKEGWTLRHASTANSGRKSSRYLVSPDGKYELRLSDHYLPDTPQREFSRSIKGPRWADEIVLDGTESPSDLLDQIRRGYREFIGDE
jgi:hypothetical protein